jgi:hypothetical protein
MNTQTMLKLGQIVGALLMAAGVASCSMGKIETSPIFFLLGGILYGACRLSAWLSKK